MDLKKYYLDQKKATPTSGGFSLSKPQFGVTAPQQNYNGFNVISEMGGQAVGGFANVASNTVKGVAGLADAINPVNLFSRATGIGQPVNVAQTITSPVTGALDYSTEAINKVQRAAGTNPDSMSGGFGRGLGTVAGVLGSSMAGGALGAGAGKALAAGGGKVAEKLMPFLGSSFGSTQGGVMATSGTPASVGEMVGGLGIDIATLGLGKLIKKAGVGIRNLAYADALGATPTEKAILAKKGIDIGEEMQKTVGFSMSKKDMAQKLQKGITAQQNTVDDILKQADKGKLATKELSHEIIRSFADAQDEVMKATKKMPKTQRVKVLKAFGDEATQWVDDLQNQYLGASGVEDIYRDAAGRVNWDKIDKRSLDIIKSIAPGTAGEQIANMQVRRAAGDILERVAPGVLQAKAKQAPLIAMKNILAKRGARATGLTDVLGAFGSVATGNPFVALGTSVGGRAMQSVPFRTGIATGGQLASQAAGIAPYVSNLMKSYGLPAGRTKTLQ